MPRAGAERAAHLDFVAAFGHAGKEKIGEIGAGHHEAYQGHSRPGKEERRAHGAGGFFGQWDDERADAAIRIVVCRRGAARQCLNFGLRLGSGNAALQARNRVREGGIYGA